jgi:hypothetical protein
MALRSDRANQVAAGVFLIGLAALFYTGRWWPGIMFLIGAMTIVEGLVKGRGWYAFQAGAWLIGIGVWAFFHFSLVILFALIGASLIIGAFAPPPMLEKKPQPQHPLE